MRKNPYKYLKKIANRAQTGIFKPFEWNGGKYVIKPSLSDGEDWQLWDMHANLMTPHLRKSTCIGLAELTGEELRNAIHQMKTYRIIEEVHES